jgi:ABC-2 type transport system permease protein
VSSLRLFFRGGITSYRALFGWLSPWILIPSFIVTPLFQILFFAYVGRAAGVGDDRFFLIGNAVQYASIPCLFAMGNAIANERREQTLGLLLVTPARRIPLFLGRALPVILNGFLVAVVAFVLGGLMLGVRVPWSAVLPLVAVVAIATYSCTGLGLVTAAISLRVRESAVLVNTIFGVLLIFCGVNVPLDELPRWMSATAQLLPLTHGIDAARQLAAGGSWADVGGLVATELAVGTAYLLLGLATLAWFESQSRRLATLELF